MHIDVLTFETLDSTNSELMKMARREPTKAYASSRATKPMDAAVMEDPGHRNATQASI